MQYFSDEKLNDLALKLRAFAEQEARVRKLVFWKILRNKAIVSICKKLPKTIEELQSKKVLMGKKAIENYGETIVGIVNEWCESEDRDLCEEETNSDCNSSMRLYEDGVMTIKQGGFYYNVSGNDALILHKYFGYKLFGVKTLRTGFPVAGEKTVLSKLDTLSINYDLIDKDGNVVVSKRFENNLYETIPVDEENIVKEECSPKEQSIKINLKDNERNKYFYEHPELIVGEKSHNDAPQIGIKEKSRAVTIYNKESANKNEVKKQWSLVLALSEAAMDAEKQDVATTVLHSYYEEVIALLTNFVKSVLPERESDIILYRILSKDYLTLQAIGDKHGISREHVCQLETKKWRTITNGFHRSSLAVFATWRKDLCDILLNINVSHFIQAMAYFLKENTRVGEFLIQVSTPTYRPEAYQTAISQYSFKRKLEVKSGERIPQDIVEQVRNIEIVPFIQSIQELVPQGEIYKGTCLKCSCKSIVVYPKDNSYYCYSCKKGGNIITYIMEHDNINYRDAVLKLAEIYHIGETDTFVARPVVMKEAALFYHEQLKTNSKNRKAIDIIHSWGISGKTVVRLGLGFNDDSYDSALKYFNQQKQISLESLMRDSIIGKTEKGTYYDRMRNSIIIPTVDRRGNVVCFDCYVIDKGAFSHYPPCQEFYRKENLYSLNLAIKSQKKSVIVVSDYLSYFALASRGIFNVVSTYMPQISEAQMDLLKKDFRVVILAVNSVADLSVCRRFCQKNDMYCDLLQVDGFPSEYISENINDIVQKIDYYETIFNS